MATAAKFVLPIPIFLAYLVPQDVDVTANITAKPFHKYNVTIGSNYHIEQSLN
jgi:hypothetical protein